MTSRILRPHRIGSLRHLIVSLMACLPLLLPACTDALFGGHAALDPARSDLAAGRLGAAHAEFLTVLKGNLDAKQRREAQDALCAIEVQTGAPTYSLLHQYQTCAAAAREPGSNSGPLLARLDDRIREKQAAEMRRALAGRDLAAAISVALAYRAVAPQDDPGSSRWNRKIWALATAQEDAGAHVSKARLTRTLALLSPEFPGERKMTRRSFEQWIQDSAWKPASSAPTAVVIHKAQLKLTIDSHEPGAPALNARSLGRINDAFTVWCHCNGTTYTVDGSTGLPLSIARVNPWLMRSEVIEMPQPAGGQVPDSSAGPERADKDSPRRETQVRRRSTTG